MAESINPRDRLALVGKTGTGKTFTAERLTSSLRRLVVIDAKGTLGGWDLEPWSKDVEKRLRDGSPVRARYLTPIETGFEPLFKLIYDSGNVTLYIDEVYAVATTSQPGQWLTALYTRGRELGIGVWAATQRPTWIPLFILSESEWIFLYRLQLERDKQRMATLIGDQALRPLREHNVLVYHQDWEQPKFYKRVKG